jgi:hypothetical protein
MNHLVYSLKLPRLDHQMYSHQLQSKIDDVNVATQHKHVAEIKEVGNKQQPSDLIDSIEQNPSEDDENLKENCVDDCAKYRSKSKGDQRPEPVEQELDHVDQKWNLCSVASKLPNSPACESHRSVENRPCCWNNLERNS